MSMNRKSNAKFQPDGQSGFFRALTLVCFVGLSAVTSGCFTSWVSPAPHIAPPATKIAPTSMAGVEPSAPKPGVEDASAAGGRSGLLTPPLPKDLPQIPFPKE